jgi:hypothetical protein
VTNGWEFVKNTSLAFTYMEKTYNNIDRQEISKLLLRTDVFKGLMEKVKKMYVKCENTVYHWQKIWKYLNI